MLLDRLAWMVQDGMSGLNLSKKDQYRDLHSGRIRP